MEHKNLDEIIHKTKEYTLDYTIKELIMNKIILLHKLLILQKTTLVRTKKTKGNITYLVHKVTRIVLRSN